MENDRGRELLRDTLSIMKRNMEFEDDMKRNPPSRLTGLTGCAHLKCISCGANADFWGRVPCGH